VDRGIALPFRDFGARSGRWSAPRPGRFTPGKNPVPIVQEARWAPGPIWTCAKNRTPTGIRSPDHPARSQSPYRLSYPAVCKDVQRLNWEKRGVSFVRNLKHMNFANWEFNEIIHICDRSVATVTLVTSLRHGTRSILANIKWFSSLFTVCWGNFFIWLILCADLFCIPGEKHLLYTFLRQWSARPWFVWHFLAWPPVSLGCLVWVLVCVRIYVHGLLLQDGCHVNSQVTPWITFICVNSIRTKILEKFTALTEPKTLP
jgi:hypothetical protein